MDQEPKFLETNIGKYQLAKNIGQGAFGEVWLANDPKNGNTVALKTLELEQVSKQDILRFKREFEILSELRHSNLSSVIDFGWTLGEVKKYFFTSDFCEGQHLYDACAGKSFEYIESIFVQVLSALDYIHAQGIIHFDIKNQNIIVREKDGEPFAKLIDFGVAAKLRSLPNEYGGTIAYLAPEIIAQSRDIDHRVDLYSLGILYFRALTGKWPFGDINSAEVMEWHQHKEISEEMWKCVHMPLYVRDLISKLLKKQPSERFTNSRVILNFINLATHNRYRRFEQSLQGQIISDGPLVGREKIMARLQTVLECMMKKEKMDYPNLIYMSGEQGIGKSRILREFRQIIELQEINFIDVNCKQGISFWTELKEKLHLEEEPAVNDKLLEMSFASRQNMENFASRRLVYDLIKYSQSSPLCLILDDYQEAEAALQQFIQDLTVRLKRENQTEIHPQLLVVIATERDMAGDVKLEKLSLDEVRNFLYLVIGDHERLDTSAKLLWEYSGGLPILMTEALKFISPYLFKEESLQNLLPPPQIALLYQDKIKSLSNNQLHILNLLSLLGRAASEQELAAMSKLSVENLLKPLLVLEKYGLVSKDYKRNYLVSCQALAHEMVQQLNSEVKKKFHQKIAYGLSETLPQVTEEVAYHLVQADEPEKAKVIYSKVAMVKAGQGNVYQAALFYEEALKLCKESSQEFVWYGSKASRYFIYAGQYRKSEEILKKIVRTENYESYELWGLLFYKQRKMSLAREYYQKALNLVPENMLLNRILLTNAIANVDLHTGNIDSARQLFNRTIVMENELDEKSFSFIDNNNMGLALSLLGLHDDSIEFYTQRLKKCSEINKAQRLMLMAGYGYVLVNASRLDEAIMCLQDALALSEKSGLWHLLFSIMGNLLTAYLKKADYAAGLNILNKMVKHQERLGTARDLAFNLLRQGSLYILLGINESAKTCFEKGKSIATEISDESLLLWHEMMLGFWELDFGNVETSKQLFQEVLKKAEQQNNKDIISHVHYGLATLFHDSHALDQAWKHLAYISGSLKNDDLFIQVDLLMLKMEIAEGDCGDMKERFHVLEATLKSNDKQEYLWEFYLIRGHYEYLTEKLLESHEDYLQGLEMLRKNALRLPEEYRDRYLKVRINRKFIRKGELITVKDLLAHNVNMLSNMDSGPLNLEVIAMEDLEKTQSNVIALKHH